MSYVNKRQVERFTIEKNPTLTNKVFSGSLFDSELNLNNSGYLFHYALDIKSYIISGDKCIIKDAVISIGGRSDISFKPVDIQKEITTIKKELQRYTKLAEQHPIYTDEHNVSHQDMVKIYTLFLEKMENIQQPVLKQVSLQIKDTLNSEENINCKIIDFNNLNVVSFNSKRRLYSHIMWKKVS